MITDLTDVKLTISFVDPDLDEEEKEAEVIKLLAQMKNLDEVEEVGRVAEASVPQNSKSISGYIAGKVWTFVKSQNIKQVWGFLSERLGNKVIEVEAEANGKKIKVKAKNSQELQEAVKAVQEFIKS